MSKEKEIARILEAMGWVLLSHYVSDKEIKEWSTPEGIFKRFVIGLLDQGDVMQLKLVETYLNERGLFSYHILKDMGKDKITEILERSGYYAQFKFISKFKINKNLPPEGLMDIIKLVERYNGNLHKFYEEIKRKSKNMKDLYINLEKLVNDKDGPPKGLKIRFLGHKKFRVLIRDLAFSGVWDRELLEYIPIPVDIHVREFFKQLDWGTEDKEIEEKASSLFNYPAIADIAIWEIHRTLCKSKKCDNCFIEICKKKRI